AVTTLPNVNTTPTPTTHPYTTLVRSTSGQDHDFWHRRPAAAAPEDSRGAMHRRDLRVSIRTQGHFRRLRRQVPLTGTFWTCVPRSEELTSELQSRENLVYRLLLEKHK